MQKGNINGAIKVLTNNINEETLKLLHQRIPTRMIHQRTYCCQTKNNLSTRSNLKKIDEMVRRAASKTKGGAGPSGLDANDWCRILTSNSYGTSSSDLCKTMSIVDPKSIEALLASRLIPPNKNPGLRPIGVGEILRRIARKVVTTAIREEIISSVGCLQTCAGVWRQSVNPRYMSNKFDEEESEAGLRRE